MAIKPAGQDNKLANSFAALANIPTPNNSPNGYCYCDNCKTERVFRKYNGKVVCISCTYVIATY